MITLSELRSRQHDEVAHLRDLITERLTRAKPLLGPGTSIALTGSVARGDARIGPFGIYIDLLVVESLDSPVDLVSAFGPDAKANLPHHCVQLDDRVGIAISKQPPEFFETVLGADEATKFALCESVIVEDPSGQLVSLISRLSQIPELEQKRRALEYKGRFEYLTGDYRYEKWEDRSAWTQVAQIMNKATEIYCSFLHCINGKYVPRVDWLTYLTYELGDKPVEHGDYMEALYSTALSRTALRSKHACFLKVGDWMNEYCKHRGWIEAST